MNESLRKMRLFGIGVLAITEEKIRNVVSDLVETGEMNREEGKKLVHELLSEKREQVQELDEKIRESLQDAIERSHIATKDDIACLEERITSLEDAIKELK